MMMFGLFPKVKAPAPSKIKVLALSFHADWCENSLALVSSFSHLKNRFDGQAVLFVRLDYTNKTTMHQANLLAEALGIHELTSQFGYDTGFVLLMDYESRKPIARLTPKASFNNMVGAIAQGLFPKIKEKDPSKETAPA